MRGGRLLRTVRTTGALTCTSRRFELARVLVVMTVDAQKLPIAAVGRIVVVVMIAVVHRELLEIAAIELARTAAADPRIDGERLFTIAFGALVTMPACVGDD